MKRDITPIYLGDTVLIPLTRGLFAIVDLIDYEAIPELRECRWSAYKTTSKTFYARACINGEQVRMHSLIAGMKNCDHKNRNGIDNRRENLRPATKRQQGLNRGLQDNNKSGYKGVFWNKANGNWRVNIWIDGKNKHIGCFGNKIDAAKAYNEAVLQSDGQFACLNPTP